MQNVGKSAGKQVVPSRSAGTGVGVGVQLVVSIKIINAICNDGRLPSSIDPEETATLQMRKHLNNIHCKITCYSEKWKVYVSVHRSAANYTAVTAATDYFAAAKND